MQIQHREAGRGLGSDVTKREGHGFSRMQSLREGPLPIARRRHRIVMPEQFVRAVNQRNFPWSSAGYYGQSFSLRS